MNVRELFEFVTDPNITAENIDAYLDVLATKVAEREASGEPVDAATEVAENVFQKVFIPSTLDEVVDAERDLRLAERGETDAVGGYMQIFKTCVFRFFPPADMRHDLPSCTTAQFWA